jgi:PPM family protein phosphatase
MSEPQISSDMAVMKPHDMDTAKSLDACPPLDVRSFGLTDAGKVRDTNEDQFLIAVLLKALQVERTSLPQPKLQHSSDRSYIFVVADGIGGHVGGERASALAIDSVESFILETFKWFAQCKGKERDQVLADFQSALGHANARVLAEAAEFPELRGMGTTLTLAYSLNDELFVAHVGDSRCYLCRHGLLYRLTCDHTLVEDMVRQGALPAEEAAQHRLRHVITNAVGANSPEVTVEVHKVHLEVGDRVLLCSDGLTEMLPDEKINQILQTEAEPEQACRRLVTYANEAGGKDNITVVVAHFRAAKQPEETAQNADGRTANQAQSVLARTDMACKVPTPQGVDSTRDQETASDLQTPADPAKGAGLRTSGYAESLRADDRADLGPAQMVERKLRALLRHGSVPVSSLRTDDVRPVRQRVTDANWPPAVTDDPVFQEQRRKK